MASGPLTEWCLAVAHETSAAHGTPPLASLAQKVDSATQMQVHLTAATDYAVGGATPTGPTTRPSKLISWLKDHHHHAWSKFTGQSRWTSTIATDPITAGPHATGHRLTHHGLSSHTHTHTHTYTHTHSWPSIFSDCCKLEAVLY